MAEFNLRVVEILDNRKISVTNYLADESLFAFTEAVTYRMKLCMQLTQLKRDSLLEFAAPLEKDDAVSLLSSGILTLSKYG